MFNSNKGSGKGKGKKKNKGKKEKPAEHGNAYANEQQQQQDPNGIPYGETEMALLRLHSNLIDFYSKHNPMNVNEEVLTILMQFFIDAGGVALNKKLMAKYGEDLQTFKRLEEPPPPPMDVDMDGSSKTLNRMKRQSQRAVMEEEYGISLPPPPKIETNVNPDQVRQSLDSQLPPSFDHKPKKKRVIKDKELEEYKKSKNKEVEDLAKAIDDDLFGPDPPQQREDPSLKLYYLDTPKSKKLSPRDLIEAFYSKHDESKLDTDASIDKFVVWVEEHSLEELSKKLKGKYNEGLMDMQTLARRRRNLEDLLTVFYLKHDRPKLDTRWTILKILSWTMQNGVEALNRKFITRYGFPVIDTSNDLDI